MPTVADTLREAREARGLSVQQVAEVTKIRSDHVTELEAGNYQVFSAPVYLKGFVRTYATLLKLEVPVIMSALDQELRKSDTFKEPLPPVVPPNPILRWVTLQLSKLTWRTGSLIAGGIAVFIMLWVLYSAVKKHLNADPLVNLPPGVYKPTQSGETLPLPVQPPATNPPPANSNRR